jgi:hypothetical protein
MPKTKYPKNINVRLTEAQYEYLGKCKSRAVRKLINADMCKGENFTEYMRKEI